MLRLLLALFLTFCAAASSDARGLHGGVADPSVAHLGLAATRALAPDAISASFGQANYQSIHYARETTCNWQLLNGNWYANNSTGEIGTGGSATITESIGYPVGSPAWYQVKWSGASSVTMADNTTAPLSDATNVCMTAGDAFYVRTYWTSAAGKLLYYSNICNTAGEIAEAATSGLTDKTMSGTIAGTFFAIYHPVAIVAQAQNPSVAIMGDSINTGYTDNFSSTACDLGITARSIGPTLAYTNLAVFGESAQVFVGNHANRAIAASYATSVISDYGTNDLAAGRSLAQLVADLTTISGYWAKPFWQTTMIPRTSSTDNWTSAVNQTLSGSTQLQTFNINLRNGTYTFDTAGWFDTANPLEGSTSSGVNGVNTGLWLWDASPQHYTNDGAHPNQTGYLKVKAAGVINPALIQ